MRALLASLSRRTFGGSRRTLCRLVLLGCAAGAGCGGEAKAPPSELGRWMYGVPKDEAALAARRLNVASLTSGTTAGTPGGAPSPVEAPSAGPSASASPSPATAAAPPAAAPAPAAPPTPPPTAAPPSSSMATAGEYKVVPVTDGGTVRVKVRLKAAPPSIARIEPTKDTTRGCTAHDSERLRFDRTSLAVGDAIVSLKGIAAGKDWPEAWRSEDRALLIDQKGCVYVPHVAVIPPATQLVIQNSDAAEHNIHGYKGDFSNTKFNVSSPPGSKVGDVSEAFLELPATYVVKCDIHPWMNATYLVAPHPYHEVTSEKPDPARGTEAGEVVFTDVPPGTYEVVVWHEGMTETPMLSDGKISSYTYSADIVESGGSVTVPPRGTVAREVAIPYR